MSTFRKGGIEQREEKEEMEIDLGQLLSVILKKLWIILLTGFTVAVIAFLVTKLLVTPIYESSTKIYVMSKQAETTGMTASDLQTSTLLTKDYQQLITSRAVLNQVIEDENLDMTYQELLGAVTVNTPVDTRIVEILVSNPDPKMAQDIANSVRMVAADHIQKVMDSQAVNTVDEANLATQPSKPSILKNTVIGGLLGIFLAIGIVVIIFLLDDRIRSVEDIEQYLGLGVLGSIPIMTEEKKKKTKGSNRYNSSKRGRKVQKSQASRKIEPQQKKEV